MKEFKNPSALWLKYFADLGDCENNWYQIVAKSGQHLCHIEFKAVVWRKSKDEVFSQYLKFEKELGFEMEDVIIMDREEQDLWIESFGSEATEDMLFRNTTYTDRY